MKIKDLIIILNAFKKQFSSAVFYCWDIFRFLLARRKTNAETLKLFRDSFSLHKVSFRGLAEKKCQKQSFHFSLPKQTLLCPGHSARGMSRSWQGGEQEGFLWCCWAQGEQPRSWQQGPRVGALPSPAGTVPQRKKEAVTANSRTAHLHQSSRFSPPVQC